MALPCLQTYYIASQLAHEHWWFYPEANNAASTLEATILTSYESLQNRIHRLSTRGREGTNVLSMTLRIFKLPRLLPSSTHTTCSPNAPLWGNPCVQEFFHRTDGGFWFKWGARLTSHLFYSKYFRSFAEFLRDYGLPPTAYFQYLHIRHTATTQFGLRNIDIQPSPLKRLLTDPSYTKLLSTYYKNCLHSTTNRICIKESK